MKFLRSKYICFFSFSSALGFGQTVNEGVLTILPQTDVTTIYSFLNEKEGAVKNDGNFYFHGDLTNEGLYTFDGKHKSSYAVFQSTNDVIGAQKLKGSAPIEFYDVLFNNSTIARSFVLNNDISISGTANFKEGIIQIDSLMGAMVFQPNAVTINVSDKSFVEGQVEKIGKEEFTYPIGDAGFYRNAHISSQPDIKGTFLGKYYFKNSNQNYPHTSKNKEIELIDNQEYWTIDKEAGKSDIILTLSWDSRTTPVALSSSSEDELHIVRWDSTLNLWVDEGGVVDLANQTITTPTTVDGYGVFTLGKLKSAMDLVIYNAVSPNGDGLNDYFIIENIDRYPVNTVQIFNRWGVKVFDTKNYDTNDNVFRGYSEGRGTIKKNDKLPTGTYFYIVNYESSDATGVRMNKKSGYIHLENN